MTRFGTFFLAAAVILLSVLLVLAAVQKSFWEDETLTAGTAEGGIEKITQLAERDMHPPLMYLTAYLGGKIFGFNELGIRSLSIISAVLTLLVVFIFSSEAFDDRTAVYSTVLLVFSPIFILYSYNARYYSLAAFLTITAVYSTFRLSSDYKFVFLLIYVAASTGLLYLVYLSISVLIACNTWWFLTWWRDRTNKKHQLLTWLFAQFLILVMFLFGFRFISTALQNYPTGFELQNFLREVLIRVAYFSYSFSIGETISPLNPFAVIGLITVIGIALFALWNNRKDIIFWLPVIVVAMVLMFNLAASFNPKLETTWQNISNRSIYALPLFLIFLASGISKMKPRLSLVTVSVLVFVYLISLVNFYSNKQYIRPIFMVNWNDVFQHISENSVGDSVVICNWGDSACLYYSKKYGYTANRPQKWWDLKDDDPAEVWWIKSNLNRELPFQNETIEVFNDISNEYILSDTFNYAQEDPSIRILKNKILNLKDIEYRVNVYQFSKP